jgi:nucleotide-binding universal stress UspA family protein
MDTQRIIVGVDGSPESRAALRWAVREAALHSGELDIVTVFDWRVVGGRIQVGGGYADAAREAAEATVEAAAAEAQELDSNVPVTTRVLVGGAAPTLIELGSDSSMIAVGSRGRGGFNGLLLGSVSQQVATHAPGPVAIVRGRTDTGSGPVVAGVDGSAAARRALGVAFEEADARGAKLTVVNVDMNTTPDWGNDEPLRIDGDAQERLTDAEEMLAQEVAPWARQHPDVVVQSSVRTGHPGEVLTELSSTAQLVVVGTRGHGGFVGLLLGAVGLQLTHHADCPVLIVRSPAPGAV